MGVILAADDICKGDYVAVHSPDPKLARRLRHFVDTQMPQHLFPVPLGVPMRVVAISLPFVACSIIQPGGSESSPLIIDMRVARLCRVDIDFVEAIQAYSNDSGHEGAPTEQV